MGSAHTLCDRRSHHTSSGLQDEPEDSEAGGGDIRVDEDRWEDFGGPGIGEWSAPGWQATS